MGSSQFPDPKLDIWEANRSVGRKHRLLDHRLVGDATGRLSLWTQAPNPSVIALGRVPGCVRAIEPGWDGFGGNPSAAKNPESNRSVWWVLLTTADLLDEVEQFALAKIRVPLPISGASSGGDLSLEWMRNLGSASSFELAPIPQSETIWVVQSSPEEARRLGPGGRTQRLLELPLKDPIGCLGTEGGGLVVAFSGAIVRWNQAGRIVASRGGLGELEELRALP